MMQERTFNRRSSILMHPRKRALRRLRKKLLKLSNCCQKRVIKMLSRAKRLNLEVCVIIRWETFKGLSTTFQLLSESQKRTEKTERFLLDIITWPVINILNWLNLIKHYNIMRWPVIMIAVTELIYLTRVYVTHDWIIYRRLLMTFQVL